MLKLTVSNNNGIQYTKGSKNMAEEFLTLMAELDNDTQTRMSEWYDVLKNAGFTGMQTPGLPYHISLATFPLEKEQEAAELIREVASAFSTIPVHISHIGMFSGGKVLFCAPERESKLNELYDACKTGSESKYPWTPHITMLIDEPDKVYSALPLLVKSFYPFIGNIIRLRLCAFWPTREIVSIELNEEILSDGGRYNA